MAELSGNKNNLELSPITQPTYKPSHKNTKNVIMDSGADNYGS